VGEFCRKAKERRKAMRNEEGGHNAGGIILSFFVGGLVGAGVALLLAPRAGKETRERIRELADDVREKAEEYAGQVKSKATTAVEKGKELFEEKKSVFSKAIEAGKEAYEKEKGKLVKDEQ
jgi:gas vesicle protein